MRFDIGGHKWLRLLLVAGAIYVALLPVWWYALDALTLVSGNVAGWIYHFFDPNVMIVAEGKLVRITAASLGQYGFDSQTMSSALRIDRTTYGLPMLAALILVTRASWAARLRSLGIGLAIMSAMTVPAIMLWAKMTSLQMDDRFVESSDRASFYYFAFHGYAFSQPVIAVILWFGLMTLGFFKWKGPAKGDVSTPTKRVARNEPCTCGSGRKYKRCCGRDPNR